MSFTPDETRLRGANPNGLIQIPGWKRGLDIALIMVVFPLLLPLMGFVALVIWMASPGPVLFKQERVGYRGRRFMCLKFRSMFIDADTAVHEGHLKRLMNSDVPLVKMDVQGDRRVIPLGSLLRSSGFDELPQIINVLRGEMSLVGPRPCLPYEYDNYLPWQKERFETVPGLTGLWQVSGKNKTTFSEMIQLDIAYVRNMTLWQDCRIILKTIPAVVVQMWDSQRSRLSSRPALPKVRVSARVY